MKTSSQDPTHLGGYRLDRLLGRGGMGEVFLAWDARLERHVAIKRILPDPPPDAAARTRFRREARAVARLSHPAIVQIFELLVGDGEDTASGDDVEGNGQGDGDDCLVMEYVEGRGLAEVIAEGSLGLRDTLRLATEIADGLAEAHSKGLVHRDLKPENVRLTTSGRAKILDFGLARLLWSEGLDHSTLEKAVTQSGALVGTVHAMSPEQASGRPVDHRSDLFALGTLLYEMLSGQAPFRGLNVLDTLRRVTSEAPTPLVELRPGLPGELLDLVDGLMAKEPAERPQNAHVVVDALEQLRGSSAVVGWDREEPRSRSEVARVRAGRPIVEDGSGIENLPTGELILADPDAARLETAVRTLVATELDAWEALAVNLGAARSADVIARHDRRARDLLARHGGREVDKGHGFLLLFERPVAAIAWALAYHRGLAALSAELSTTGADASTDGTPPELEARVAIHLGEVVLRHNSEDDVSRGAQPIEVDGAARPAVANVLSLALPRQTLLTHAVFDLGRRAAQDDARWDEALRWLAHGGYLLAGADEPVEVYEVGVEGVAPLVAPADSSHARRVVSVSGEQMLGWRPAPGQAIPRRASWQLETRLGEGGFGEVWRARHPSGEQRVFKFCFEASKLRALQREVTLFRLLKEALGDRDDIARVLDWNLDAAPYFLEIEHTEGGDLVRWAEEQGGIARVPRATRIELAAQVAEALAAAHSVGVLHKDVKPANVLIRPPADGGPPRVRLTDFGIGALVDPSRLDGSGVTALGFSQPLTEESSAAGTRRYLAPELLAGTSTSPGRATVQADLYSLGVVLYQLAVGDLERPIAPGWQRGLDDPLLTQDIARLVDGDPSRRPASAEGVASALRRLDARRAEQTQAERAERRRRWTTWTAVVIFVLLLGVLVVASRERKSRQTLEAAQQKTLERQQQAEGLIRFMLGDLREKLEPIGRLDVLDTVGEQALEYFEAVPQDDLSADELVSYATALHQIGDLAHQQGDLEGALTAFEQALEMSQGLASRNPDQQEWLRNLGEAHFKVGFVFWRRGQLDSALEQFEAYLGIAQDLAGRRPEDPELQLELIHGHSNIASVLERQGDLDGALARFRTGLAIGEVMVARDPGNRDFQLELAITHNALGVVLNKAHRLGEAVVHHRREVEIKQALVSAEPDNQVLKEELAVSQGHLGDVLDLSGEVAQAIHHLENADQILAALVALDPTNRKLQHFLGNNQSRLGIAKQRFGDVAAARLLFERSAQVLEAVVASDPTDTLWQADLASTYLNLGWSRWMLGQSEQAAQTATRVTRILEGPLQPEPDQPLSAVANRRWAKVQALRGQLAADRGDPREAVVHWQQALAAIESAEVVSWSLAEVQVHVLNGLERPEEAEALLEQWLANGVSLRRFTMSEEQVSR